MLALALRVISVFAPKHMRGTSQHHVHVRKARQFIPAPAGNIEMLSILSATETVHPRACGEHQHSVHGLEDALGSSPRLRGTCPPIGSSQTAPWFIPAPAGNIDHILFSPLPTSVHPRACGEHGLGANAIPAYAGSSPRLRGTYVAGIAALLPRRFIPAPAGNMSVSGPVTPQTPVHPRACGEHIFSVRQRSTGAGSSPRLRGTSTMHLLDSVFDRFIPAPAGNIKVICSDILNTPVHPRACGEHGACCGTMGRCGGSSPRLRGTFDLAGYPLNLIRFIPAPAGNIRSSGRACTRTPVHPRACGEHSFGLFDIERPFGSSPRLRGTCPAEPPPATYCRFIPAPAGNIPFRYRAYSCSTVHPRACGEHRVSATSALTAAGSSPRLRGTSHGRTDGAADNRFIPAPAGNITIIVLAATITPVHPRACGEHQYYHWNQTGVDGSSPRLRGTYRRPVYSERRARFIPAPAGNIENGGLTGPELPVHPRACGEHTRQDESTVEITGSSPRLRGTCHAIGIDLAFRRFIPAPAGNMQRPNRTCPSPTVHPRACGEHLWVVVLFTPRPGSSPRLRGTYRPQSPAFDALRFIPAPAGNMAKAATIVSRAAVHPRACGEHSWASSNRRSIPGSSPRLRGTCNPKVNNPRHPRFIPAPAGNIDLLEFQA